MLFWYQIIIVIIKITEGKSLFKHSPKLFKRQRITVVSALLNRKKEHFEEEVSIKSTILFTNLGSTFDSLY